MKNKKLLTSAINELQNNLETGDLWVSLFFAILIENEIKELIEENTNPRGHQDFGLADRQADKN